MHPQQLSPHSTRKRTRFLWVKCQIVYTAQKQVKCCLCQPITVLCFKKTGSILGLGVTWPMTTLVTSVFSTDQVAKMTHEEKQHRHWISRLTNKFGKIHITPLFSRRIRNVINISLPSIWWEGCVKSQLQSLGNLWGKEKTYDIKRTLC